MFSLVLTLVSIALVASLAMATLYYAGPSLTKGQASADANIIVSQGRQIHEAAEMFNRDYGQWPASIQELVDRQYLRAVPTPPAAGSSAAPSKWFLPIPREPLFMVETDTGVCSQVNMTSYASKAIALLASTEYTMQCFGTSASTLKTLIVDSPVALSAASGTADVGTVRQGPTPSPSGTCPDANWLVCPASN